AYLHVHLEEIEVDKTLCFVEEPVEIIEHEVKSLKRSRIPIVKSIGTRSEVSSALYWIISFMLPGILWFLALRMSSGPESCKMTRQSESQRFRFSQSQVNQQNHSQNQSIIVEYYGCNSTPSDGHGKAPIVYYETVKAKGALNQGEQQPICVQLTENM
ncbi:hypothetical protein Tco_0985856, partial [Tanacetum coccineum]